MYGLPGQALADVEATIDEAIRLAPSRIAFFGYAHLPQMIPRQPRIDAGCLPDQRLRFEQAPICYPRLTAAGYFPVVFDPSARPADSLTSPPPPGPWTPPFQGLHAVSPPPRPVFRTRPVHHFPVPPLQNTY